MKVIDIHIHGGFGICFDNITKSLMEEFAKKAYEKEIAGFCPTLTGDSPDRINEKLLIIKEAKKSLLKGAKIIGANLEGTFLNPEKPGVQDPKVFLEPTIDNFKKITKGAEDIVKIVVVAPETIKDKDFIPYLKSKDIKVHFGHTKTNEIKEADGICHLYNAMNPLTHKTSTLQSKALLDKNIYTELIADTVHVTEDILKITFKLRDLNKIILISDALPIAGSNLEYINFCGKKILKTGLDENGILGGSVKFLPEIIRNLDKKEILPLDKAQKMCFDNVLEYLKTDLF